MNKERVFLRKDGNISSKCLNYYWQIKDYAISNKLENTLRSLELAIDLHNSQFRDNGEPYIIHPMETMLYMMILNLTRSIYEICQSSLAETRKQMDFLFSAALLHDTKEDCKIKFKNHKDRINSISAEVWNDVNALSKDKEDPSFSFENYLFYGIGSSWRRILIKFADRICNYSTIDVFKSDRMADYVREVSNYFYVLSREGQNNFPEFSRYIRIMNSFLVSISETVASIQGLKGIIQPSNPEELVNYISGFVDGNGKMPNTKRALACAQRIYSGHKRKSGDDFIIHPLKVCETLLNSGITKDNMCATALVHEAIKKCNMKDNAIELVTEWHLSPAVRDSVVLLSSNRYYSLGLYYHLLGESPDEFVIKLANRVNTCTNLLDLPSKEKTAYLTECNQYIYPKSSIVMKKSPEYSNAIRLMMFHIQAECNVSENIMSKIKKI